jgi:hypothetical protein
MPPPYLLCIYLRVKSCADHKSQLLELQLERSNRDAEDEFCRATIASDWNDFIHGSLVEFKLTEHTLEQSKRGYCRGFADKVQVSAVTPKAIRR